MSIQLYDQSQIEQIPWGEIANAERIKRVLVPMMMKGTHHFMSNVVTRLMLLKVDQHLLPLTINEKEYENANVCSLFAHYVLYAKQELSMFTSSRLIEKVGHRLIDGLGKWLQLVRINRVVIVNNWMFSTNLYPDLSYDQLQRITEALIHHFPSHAILFRSITDHHPSHLYSDLCRCHYLPVPSREVFYYHPEHFHQLPTKKRWKIRRDWRLLEESGYKVLTKEAINERDVERLVQLYHQLYIEKYSIYNVQYRKEFFHLIMNDPTFHLRALVKNQRIDGLIGFYIENGCMTTPILGYDTSLSPKLGLYRMLFGLMIKEAHHRHLLLHESAGVSQFKEERGAYDRIEYHMVYAHHLRLDQQKTWKLLQKILNYIVIPYMKSDSKRA